MPSDQLVEDLLALWRVLRQASHPVRRGEITHQQFWLLRHLRREGPLSIGELAELLGISPSSATIACKRLEKAQLLTRQRLIEDERVVQVELTPLGVETVESWRQRYRDTLSGLLAPLDEHEREELQGLLERVMDAAGRSPGGLVDRTESEVG
ncbi:MAG TPA: MarR family transcriptional regulator [Thermomicrobiaceae bacterium]|nr:MarR family transcriptional regulator [Thermomicrobiaceae bacterium]